MLRGHPPWVGIHVLSKLWMGIAFRSMALWERLLMLGFLPLSGSSRIGSGRACSIGPQSEDGGAALGSTEPGQRSNAICFSTCSTSEAQVVAFAT